MTNGTDAAKCWKCEGTGMVKKLQDREPWAILCPECGGSGRPWRWSDSNNGEDQKP